MKELLSSGSSTGQPRRKSADGPAIHVICLGAGGGPVEDHTMGFLVRSTSSRWSKGSILAVDAGSHLSAIIRLLEKHFPLYAPQQSKCLLQDQSSRNDSANDLESSGNDNGDANSRSASPANKMTTVESGPFAGVALPHASARANAAHVVREHVATYLITHPHLDHLAGFAINTAAFHNTSRPKRLAALPFTVNAIKSNIFNDIIWPNLTDEDNGVGFVTFQRLTEGGNLALGEGNSRGFIEVCDGLAVKGFKISHGRCASSGPPRSDHVRRGSLPSLHDWYSLSHTHSHAPLSNGPKTPLGETAARRGSLLSIPTQPNTPTTFFASQAPTAHTADQLSCVVDSSAFFIRAEGGGKEILMFGDVEPDSISLLPRNHTIWAEAAPKIAQGILSGIFIECSYGDSQTDAVLFGHLAPRHVIAELNVLADMVVEARHDLQGGGAEKPVKKRKRVSMGGVLMPSSVDGTGEAVLLPGKRRNQAQNQAATTSPLSGKSQLADETTMEDATASPTGHGEVTVPVLMAEELEGKSRRDMPSLASLRQAVDATSTADKPLKGLRIVIMHVKDDLTDGPPLGDTILLELHEHEARQAAQGRPLGCSFEISRHGDSYWF